MCCKYKIIFLKSNIAFIEFQQFLNLKNYFKVPYPLLKFNCDVVGPSSDLKKQSLITNIAKKVMNNNILMLFCHSYMLKIR